MKRRKTRKIHVWTLIILTILMALLMSVTVFADSSQEDLTKPETSEETPDQLSNSNSIIEDESYSLNESIAESVEKPEGWFYEDEKWFLFNDAGEKMTGWQIVGDTWYYMNSSGVMQTGWIKSGGAWYYLKSSGAMAAGWVFDQGKWYYLKSNGSMATGWLKLGARWYFLNSNGAMAVGWIKPAGAWYYMKSSGAMAVGWVFDRGNWYYLKSNGAMATGWLQLGSKWYFLKSSGAMVTGSYTVGKKRYYFYSSGAWDGKNGIWSYPGLGQDVVNYAIKWAGKTPYVSGGHSLITGTDCSGFVHLIYEYFGYNLPYSSGNYQNQVGTKIQKSQLLPGDILVYNYGEHVAIYAGDNKIIHAANPNLGVVYESIFLFGNSNYLKYGEPTAYVRVFQ